jgi:hypothetical protein
VAAGLAIAGAVAGLGAYAVSALKASDESNKIVRGLDNMISNSEAFGQSVESIEKASKTITDFTQDFALLTGISDETFNSLATAFLAAPNIAKMGADGVNRLIEISANAAAATGKDLESVGNALAKALENPETAMAKLQRANIFLSEEQKKTYQTFVDIGDIAGATEFLLGSLETKYAEAAEAAASPWGRLLETFEKLKEVVGDELGKALLPVIPLIQAAVNAMIADPDFAVVIAESAKAFADLGPEIIDLMPDLVELATSLIPLLIDLVPLLIPLVDFLTDAFGAISDMLAPLNGDLGALFGMLFVLISPFGKIIEGASQMYKTFEDLGIGIAGIFSPLGALIGFFINIESVIKRALKAYNEFIGFITGNPVKNTAGYANPAFADIPRMASGGIVMPSRGGSIVNVAEAGQPEAIIPLDRLGKIGGGATYNINVQAGVGDPQVIGQQIVAYIKRYEKASGPVFAGA